MLINTNIFRPAALAFNKDGVYTRIPRGTVAYKKFWDEERARCLNGYKTPLGSISGYFYFYLNYTRIQVVIPTPDENGKIVENDDGSIRGERIEDFPRFWDSDKQYFDYLEEAEKKGKHSTVLKCRGRGYSWKSGSMLCRNYFLIPNSKSYAIASDKGFLLGRDGILSKAWEIMSFIDLNTPFAKRRHVADTGMHKRASYKVNINGIETEKGYKSEILGITLNNDPQKARGIRGKLIIWEEAGKFPNLSTAWNISRSSMEQGNTVFGLMCAQGTGGTNTGDFEGLSELFNNPKGYNILPINNIWDENIPEGTKSAFFVPEYMNYEGSMDSEGNSLIQHANTQIDLNRKTVLENTKDTQAFKRYVAEHPRTPREAMLQLSGNIFPVQELQGILARLELDKDYELSLIKGRFLIDQNGVIQLKEDQTSRIIYNYPHKAEDNTDAPIIIYEPPQENSGVIPHGLYIAGIDPYDHDQSQTNSLGSTFIINKLTNRIVAEYTARPETSKEYYEQVRRLLIYYNARALYENERKGIFDYFESKNCLYLLCPEPRLIKDVIKKPGTSRAYGIPMPIQIKNYGIGLIKQWLLEDNPANKDVQNMHRIRSQALLKELITFDSDKNTDRVMALLCLMYQLAEERTYTPDTERANTKAFHKSEFFTRVNPSSVIHNSQNSYRQQPNIWN